MEWDNLKDDLPERILNPPGAKLRRMCDLMSTMNIYRADPKCMTTAKETACEAMKAGMTAAKTTFGSDRTGKRVYVQDMAASLNRRGLLDNDAVEEFREEGYAYMEQEYRPSHLSGPPKTLTGRKF